MNDKFERLCEAFLLAEHTDRDALGELRGHLEELLRELGAGPVADSLVALQGIVDRILAGEDLDPAQSWQSVAEEISRLQEKAETAIPTIIVDGGPGGDASSTTSPSTPAGPPGPLPELDPEILGGFVVEAREHLDAADVQLLALETDPSNVEALHTVFRAFHTIKGAAGCLDLVAMQALAHETENLLDLARKGSIPMAGEVLDAGFAAVDAMKALASDAESALQTGRVPAPGPKLDELIRRIRGLVSKGAPRRAGPVPVSTAPLARDAEEPLHSEDGPPSPAPVAAGSLADPAGAREPVRVDADRLDRLVDLIGELVIAESMVSQSGEVRSQASGGALGRSVAQLDKITRELQEMGMSLRMVPVRPLFHKMARLVRDLSRKLGKTIEFVTSGEEIEIDRAILNSASDALVHILRNALDHGIEADPAERVAAGKPASGRIDLRACHREGSIVIEVEDDGRGLDPDAILAKAVEKGIVRRGERLSEQELSQLIFLPGFSTARSVTDLSGRGVGLDVVRSAVEALRGRVELQSRRGRGTVLRLRLPLTLAIIDGMVIRAGRERYVVPTLSITRLVRPEPGQLVRLLDRDEVLTLQEESIPLFRLNRLLDVSGGPALERDGVAVIVEEAGGRAALLADEVLGQQQIVIKSLGMNLEGVPGVSGGVILADGQVGLILDVTGLLGRRASAPLRPLALEGARGGPR
jgi:two-component system chemotaxis sensor kinase CheA